MEFNGKGAKLVFTIRAVESIPCEVRGQVVAFDSDGVKISDELITPWPMPWIEREIEKLAGGTAVMPEERSFRVYNPEEPDQYVLVEVDRYK